MQFRRPKGSLQVRSALKNIFIVQAKLHPILFPPAKHFDLKDIQGDPYGRGIVYVDSKFEVAFSCKVCLLPRPVTEL